jgi:putative transposase
MPRSQTVYMKGGTYYVALYAQRHQRLFQDDDDRSALEEILSNAVARSGCRVHAYCLTSREVHLAVEIGDPPLGAFVQLVAAPYARRMNKRLQASGPLFHQGYRSILIEADQYLVRLVRVLHLIPSLVPLSKEPAQYRWSGHQVYLEQRAAPWLTTDRVLSLLAGTVPNTNGVYSTYMSAPLCPPECSVFFEGDSKRPMVLGTDGWVNRIQPPRRRVPSRVSLISFIEQLSHTFGIHPNCLSSPSQARHLSRARAIIAAQAIDAGIASLTQVARAFNRAPSSLCLAIRRYKNSGGGEAEKSVGEQSNKSRGTARMLPIGEPQAPPVCLDNLTCQNQTDTAAAGLGSEERHEEIVRV